MRAIKFKNDIIPSSHLRKPRSFTLNVFYGFCKCDCMIIFSLTIAIVVDDSDAVKHYRDNYLII